MDESIETPTGEIVRMIEAIQPFDELERTHKDEVLEWINSGESFYRVLNPQKHVVCYTVPFNPITRQIFLIDHIKSGLIIPPGGHVEFGETLVQAASRESSEELKVEDAVFLNGDVPSFITIVETVGATAGHTDVDFWYVLNMDNVQIDGSELAGESTGGNWYSFEEILAMDLNSTDQNMHRFVSKLQTI